jgi:hypothetical protein
MMPSTWNGPKQYSKVIATALILAFALTTPYGAIQQAFADATEDGLAAAMGLSTAEISSADLGTSDHTGVKVETTAAGNFPTEGTSFAVLSSGCANDVLLPNDEENHTCLLGGLNTPGDDQGHDLVQFTLVLNVPTNATNVSFDWKFYSDEFEEFVGTDFNDAFLVEKGSSNFTLSGNNVTAPNNIAFDQNDDLISINTSGNLAMTAEGASGTTYDGATPLLTTTTSVPAGSSTVTLIFSIFDMGDDAYDTTVLVDNVRFDAGGDDGSTTKKATSLDCTVPDTAASDSSINVSSTLVDATTLDPVSGATIEWSVLPSGPTATSTTDSSGVAQASLDLTGLAAGSYTVSAAFAGNDTYQVNSCEAPLEILPPSGNNPPAAVDDSAETDVNVGTTIDVLTNDTDLDGDTLTVTNVTQPANGSVVDNGDGTVTYTPNANFTGTDEFEYTISDGNSTDTAKVVVEVAGVTPENNPPTAVDDSAETDLNVGITINVLTNDTDLDGDTLTITNNTEPVNGSVVDNGDGTVTYTPNANFTGTDEFEYTISDGNSTDIAKVTIQVKDPTPPENNPPTAVDDSAETDVNVGTTIDVLTNDTDLDGDTITITNVTLPVNGSVVDNGDGTVTYTPNANFTGTDEFEYTISDGNSTDTAEVTVQVGDLTPPENNPPTAVDDSAETDLNVGITINVLTNDTDLDGDTITITNVTLPVNGAVADNGDGTVTYTPNANFTGTDEFEYTISDGNSTDAAKVTIQVGDLTPPVDYGLQLFENGTDVSDGIVNLNQEVRAVAETADSLVDQVTFRWMRPSGEIAQNVTVPISSPEDTFIPDEQGTWVVEADFGNDQIIRKMLDISFFVVPESPIGAIAMLLASMGALGGFLYFRSRRPIVG